MLIDLTEFNPFRFLSKWLRKFRLQRHKARKIKEELTPHDRNYLIKFKVKLNDVNNPMVSNFELDIVIPAKAAVYAKRLALLHLKENLELIFTSVEEIEE